MSSPASRRGVVVMGMHRSGTSALTRAINLLGAELGDPADLYVAHDNPSGHWESHALIECNDKILKAFGGSYAAPPFLPRSWENSRAADGLIPTLGRTFATVYRDTAEPWLWKDPRICLTLPLWRRVLDDFVVVLVLRKPDAIARSLRRRDGFRHGYALSLWEEYTNRALSGADGLPTAVVEFEEVQARPSAALTALRNSLATLGLSLHGDLAHAATSVHMDRVDGPPFKLSRRRRALLASLSGLPVASLAFRAPPLSPPSRWRHSRMFGPLSHPWGVPGARRYPPTR